VLREPAPRSSPAGPDKRGQPSGEHASGSATVETEGVLGTKNKPRQGKEHAPVGSLRAGATFERHAKRELWTLPGPPSSPIRDRTGRGWLLSNCPTTTASSACSRGTHDARMARLRPGLRPGLLAERGEQIGTSAVFPHYCPSIISIHICVPLFCTCKCSTLAISSVRSRRARPPHVGKGSDTRTEPCQERIRRWSRMSLARPGCLSRAPNSAKEAESAENGQGAGFALDAFDAAVSCACG
jgi:hypothetical protein